MKTENKIEMSGYLQKDIKEVTNKNGEEQHFFTLVIPETFTGQSDEPVEFPEYIPCVVYPNDKKAIAIAKTLKQGDDISLIGKWHSYLKGDSDDTHTLVKVTALAKQKEDSEETVPVKQAQQAATQKKELDPF